MKDNYKIRIRIPKAIYQEMLSDLKRPHQYAYERVGFVFARTEEILGDTTLVLLNKYVPVNDKDYIEDDTVGAKINSPAIRKAMQYALDNDCGCFHVHMHEHKGNPSPSFTDKKGLPGVVDSLANVSPNQANGFLILSENSFYASVIIAEKKYSLKPELISVIGYPMSLTYPAMKISDGNKIYHRQSFLGTYSQFYFENIRVGIVGFGGGGSHIGQQLAHIGVKNIFIFDEDRMEETNHNRLIGGWFSDIAKKMLKVDIAKRLIKKIFPKAKVVVKGKRWQECPEILQSCDIVFGSADSYSERQQLEAECRRYLIPLIDIGMDVHKEGDEPYSISGQVILSMPGMPCMTCMGFITEKKLSIEAAKYGKVGGRPQVVWPNGILASTAIGVFVDIVNGWSGNKDIPVYLSYDGNSGIINEHVRLKHCDKECNHYHLSEIGKPMFKKV